MFKVTFMVSDEKLGLALKNLVHIAAQVEAPQPMSNVEVGEKGDIRNVIPGKSACDIVKHHCIDNKLTEITNKATHALLSSMGYAKHTTPRTLWLLSKQQRFLKGLGDGRYQVIQAHQRA